MTAMRRGLGPLLVLVPLWLVCFGLSVRDAVRRTPFPPVLVDYHAHGYPTVTGPRRAGADKGELRTNDELLTWGETTLRGAREVDLFFAVAQQSKGEQAQVRIRRAGATRELQVTPGSYRVFWPRLPASVVFLLVGIMLWLRAPRGALTQSFVTMLLGGAFLFACTFSGPVWLLQWASVVQALGVSTLTVFGLRGMLLFPGGVAPRSAVIRMLPYLCLPLGLLDVERTRGELLSPQLAHRLSFLTYVVVFAVLVVDSIFKYRRADPVERRKIKWVLWGTFLACLAPGFSALFALVSPGTSVSFYVAVASLAIIPLCLFIAVLHFNLFDINRILTATASLSVFTFAGIALTLWFAPHLSRLAAQALEIAPQESQLMVALCLPFFVIAVQRGLQPRIDRLVFRERAALELRVKQLLLELSGTASPDELLRTLVARLRELLQPDVIATFVRAGENFECVSSHGAVIAPLIPAHRGLVSALSGRRGAVSFELGARDEAALVDPVGRGLLQSLDARIVLLLRDDKELLALVCLGAKASGDVYVSSDVALLHGLAEAVSQRLASFDKEATLQELRRAQATLRRYVPSAVVEGLATATDLEQGERQVTLLFADIRGYSGYAEGRPSAEVFSVISQYTRAVSALAREHGGHVVEFNGDGMMVVFGAPQPLPHREQAAVEAALSIVEGVERTIGHTADLSIGVGIASGLAFIGSIQAVDRMVWTALGETTNRAARLQVLSRELGASVVIDENTHAALAGQRERFAIERTVRLRGHARIHRVFAVPLAPAPRAARVALTGSA